MPQLKSGRHFVLSLSPFIERLSAGSNEQRYTAILHFRLNANSPRKLFQFATIGYFDPDDEGPPAGKSHSSDYLVRDLAWGKTDWLPEEIEEFNQWVEDNPALEPWLVERFAEANNIVVHSPLWTSDLILGD